MIVLAAILTGAFLGDRQARRAQGNRKDRLQYAAAYALALAIPALFATLLIDRAMRG